jgi:anion-transporting  ArsA/GET3 family ATPase
MGSPAKRLYIFTGKGGVGKTSLAMAMTKHLEAQGLKPKYNSFYQDPERSLWKELNLPVLDIELQSSAETYIGRKLKSTTIASWIMKTHFFKSLFQMIPGLGHMILLGNILDELEKDPELIIVLDSPASGHALTMFESSSNFKKIFRAGLIVKDIDKMHKLLSGPGFLKTLIVTLANELAMNEASDLKKELDTNTTGPDLNVGILVNDSFLKYVKENKISESDLPDFLKNKIELEKDIIGKIPALPHIDQNGQSAIIFKIAPYMGEFV